MHDVIYYLEEKMSWHYKYSLSVRIYLTYLNNIPNSLTIIKAVYLHNLTFTRSSVSIQNKSGSVPYVIFTSLINI